MANETNMVGVIEVYQQSAYEQVEESLSNKAFNNYFNIAIAECQLNNHGSILIPFAKCFRSKQNDDPFIDEQVSWLVKQLSFLVSFSIELFIDSFHIQKQQNVYMWESGKLNKQKFLISYLEMPDDE
jgi:hypothetical protein